MTNILLVDDVLIIRQALRIALEEHYGNFAVFEAENGFRALDLMKETNIDIVLTDIRMPCCDGLELIKRLREEEKYTNPILILTGYSEFEYAQKALKYGVLDYILKPVETAKLIDSFDMALNALEKQLTMNHMQASRSHMFEKEKAERLEQALKDALLFSVPVSEELPGGNYVYRLAILTVREESFSEVGFLSDDRKLVYFAVENIVQYMNIGLRHWRLTLPKIPCPILLLFYGSTQELSLGAVSSALHKIHANVKSAINMSMVSGISSAYAEVSRVLFDEACFALVRYVKPSEAEVLAWREQPGTELGAEAAGNINIFIRGKDFQGLSKYLKDLAYASPKTNMPGLLRDMAMATAESMIRNHACRMNEFSGEIILSAETMLAVQDINALIDQIINAAQLIVNKQSSEENQNTVEEVKKYILNHFSENFSVKTLADRFHINYSYLSALFAKETGTGIAAYISDIRMNTAKKMLAETSADISTIATSVGFGDLQYFYKVFKKTFNTTPMSYRKEAKKLQ